VVSVIAAFPYGSHSSAVSSAELCGRVSLHDIVLSVAAVRVHNSYTAVIAKM
jgi:hypothetical protein